MCASAVLPHHDDERVTSLLPPNSRLWHHSKDLNSPQDTAKHISTESGTGAILVPHKCENADRREKEKKKNEMADDDALKMKDNFTIYHWTPSVTKPATEKKNAYMTRFLAEPP